MRKRILPNMISALTLTATVLATTGCRGVATLPLESTQPVADGTEITTDEKEKPDEGATQVDLQETKGTTVTQEGPYGSITLTIPKGWEYRLCPVGDDALLSSSYGIQFYPKGQKGYVEVGYQDTFGVCGTGLKEEKWKIAGVEANVGYYDGSEIWSFVAFHGDDEKIVALASEVDAWWNVQVDDDRADSAVRGAATENSALTVDDATVEEPAIEGGESCSLSMTYGGLVMQILETLQYDPAEQSGAIGVYDDDAANDKIGVQALVTNVSDTAATVEFTRYDPQLEGEYMTGEYFSIEKKTGDQWEKLDAKDDVGFEDIGIQIPSDEPVSHEYDWSNLYGELTAGDYRINVKVWAGNKEYVLSPHFLIR